MSVIGDRKKHHSSIFEATSILYRTNNYFILSSAGSMITEMTVVAVPGGPTL